MSSLDPRVTGGPTCILVALALGGVAPGCGALPRPASSLAEFEGRLERLRRQFRVPGMSAGVARGGEVCWAAGFGQAKREAGVPATPETVFHLASLTKPFAAAVVLLLVEEGKLALDDPAARFGVALEGPGVVRVRHLLSHTSQGEPGKAYAYSGSRFGKLDGVIERASGSSFADLLSERILEPLSLGDTSPTPADAAACEKCRRDPAAVRSRLAQGYDSEGTRAVEYPNYFGTAAGLVSTAGDVARFSAALDAGLVLKPRTLEQAFSPTLSTAGGILPYGLGWFVQDFEGQRLVWHYGWWTGVSALILKVPSRRLTFVALANSDMLSRKFDLARGDVLRSPFAREFLAAFLRGPLGRE